jgi:hypothetical protein
VYALVIPSGFSCTNICVGSPRKVLKPVPGSSSGNRRLRRTVGAAPGRATNRTAALSSRVEAVTSRMCSQTCPMLEVVLPASSRRSPTAPIVEVALVLLRDGS